MESRVLCELEIDESEEIHVEHEFSHADRVTVGHKARTEPLVWLAGDADWEEPHTITGDEKRHPLMFAWESTPRGRSHFLDGFLMAVDQAREILSWDDDWDGEGSPRYEEETLQRATHFLLDGVRQLTAECSVSVHVPRILPGPDGSIDIHWQLHDRQMLLNIPASVDEPVEYFGQKESGGSIKGNFYLSDPDLEPLTWVKR